MHNREHEQLERSDKVSECAILVNQLKFDMQYVMCADQVRHSLERNIDRLHLLLSELQGVNYGC
jgi:hypothetical protein